MKRHLLSAADLSRDDAELVLTTAAEMLALADRPIKKLPALRGRTVVNLFFEDSTRTRTSFHMAAKGLGASVMNWTQSADLIIMVLVGGIGLLYGGALGAFVMLVLEELLRNWTEYWHMPLGILLLLVVFFAPKGLAGLVRIRSAADPATTAKEQA